MLRLTAIVATIAAALTLATAATAAPPSMNEDAGDGQPYEIWIEVSYTYIDGYPRFLYCRYGRFNWGVENLGCWT